MKIPAFYFVTVAMLVLTACIIEPRSRYEHGDHERGDRDHQDRDDHRQVWRE